MRIRDLGITIGRGRPGPLNAITDVAGVQVGHITLISGDGPLVVGTGPIRTGVTVVIPRSQGDWREPVFAGCHRLNGNGEVTGLEWIRESGMLHGPIATTNTHSVGVVRDALVAASIEQVEPLDAWWSLPVVGETYDGYLNDMNGFHVHAEHLHRALAAASGGPVPEGSVGGGTGSVCHGFKGGIGTASRMVPDVFGGFTVAALVQANYGKREWLRIDGVPVGAEIGRDEFPSPFEQSEAIRLGTPPPEGSGSIIVVVATDAPLLPHQCERLAQRAGLGIARVGSTGGHTSGDLFVAFATGNRLPHELEDRPRANTYDVRAVGDIVIDQLFDGVIEATEEAIVNALVAAETMVGRDGVTAHALPHDRLLEIMTRYAGARARRHCLRARRHCHGRFRAMFCRERQTRADAVEMNRKLARRGRKRPGPPGASEIWRPSVVGSAEIHYVKHQPDRIWTHGPTEQRVCRSGKNIRQPEGATRSTRLANETTGPVEARRHGMRVCGPGQPTATGAGFSIGTPIRLPYSVQEPS
jgi:D-aminopeptidase